MIERILREAEAKAAEVEPGEQFDVTVPMEEWPAGVYAPKIAGPVLARSIQRGLSLLSVFDGKFTFQKP